MPMTSQFFEPALVLFAGLALGSALLIALTVRFPFSTRSDAPPDGAQFAAAMAIAAVVAQIVCGDITGTLFFGCVAALAVLGVRIALPRLTIAGAIDTAVPPLLLLFTYPYFALLLREQGFPDWALGLYLAAGLPALLLIAFVAAGRLARGAMLTHAAWQQPRRPLVPAPAARQPKVSIHLPCYAEPPAIVMATMDRLAALDYEDYEVLICDNNTADEALWRPLEEHCARLNRQAGSERFRFFHVAPLVGAKAGALNFCMTVMAADAALVAVLDADYLAEHDFLSRLVGFFANPELGYVQTPHDYRAHDGSAYLTSCYWEYMPTNKVVYPGINEYGAAFTIGTMCVVRAKALVDAGGWAEWCLTEDSELSVRLRAIGYTGVYLRETFGRGLIPESFADYRAQRFRWTAGPVQQLRRYWRLMLPEMLGGRPGLDGWSKLLEFQRSASPLFDVAASAAALAVSVSVAAATAAGLLPTLTVPVPAWLAMLFLAAAALLSAWLRYRLAGCHSIVDVLRAEIAKASLGYVQMTAGLAGLSSRPRPWTRTPKFRARASGLQALNATLPETCIGLVHLALAAILLPWADAIGTHFLVLASGALMLSGLRFLAAPAMALLSERHIAREMPAAMRDDGFDTASAAAV